MRVIVLLVVTSALAGLGALEVVVRLADRGRCQNLAPAVSARNRSYGWGHAPGATGWAQRCLGNAPEWRTFVRINRLGLADRDIPYQRTGARRLLVLGDSFTEGFQVAFERTAVKQLERTLNAPDPPGTRIEVVNAGVSGWSTDNALLFFAAEGWRYRPDVVVLMFFTFNDVFENARELVTPSRAYPDKPYFELHDGRLVRTHYPLPAPPLPWRVAVWLHRALEPYSAVVRRLAAVSSVWRHLQAVPEPAPTLPPAHPWQVYLREYPSRWRDAWRITRGVLLRLRQRVEAGGARFVVVIVNGRDEVSATRMQKAVALHPDLATGVDADKANRLITRFLARRRIAAIPLLDGFRAAFADDATPGFFEGDIHWAGPGHDLAARLIADGLADLGLVTRP